MAGSFRLRRERYESLACYVDGSKFWIQLESEKSRPVIEKRRDSSTRDPYSSPSTGRFADSPRVSIWISRKRHGIERDPLYA